MSKTPPKIVVPGTIECIVSIARYYDIYGCNFFQDFPKYML